jgi:hypothetical protein
MNLQYINWKLHLENPAEAEPDEFFKVFSTWIPESAEIFIDVADYQHVQDGPVTLLVGHYVNYSLDQTGRRLGVLADHKQPLDGSNEDKLTSSLLGLLRVAKRLEDEPGFSHKPRFNTGDLMFIVNSRALAPNTAETYAALKPDLLKVLEKAYGKGRVTLEHRIDLRQRFMVQVTVSGSPSLNEVLNRLLP